MTTENLFTLLTLWMIKPLLISLIILAGTFLLRKKSAALQHFWLASGVLAIVLLPVFAPIIPSISWQILPAQNSDNQQVMTQWFYLLLEGLQHPRRILIIFALYFLVASWLLSYFWVGVWQLYRQTRTASMCRDKELQDILHQLHFELGIDRKISLCTSTVVYSPQTWGLWRPVIMLPVAAADWSSDRKLAVLIHELGHIARWDWATTILVKVVCALFWFLPPVWWLVARLEQCAEMACDDFIYRLRDRHVSYAENLLALAQTPKVMSGDTNTPALPMAGHAPIYYRIQAILDHQRSHSPVAPETGQYWILTLIMLLLPLAALQVMPIRETLLAKLWVVQQHSKPSALDDDNAVVSDTQLLLSDRQRLQALKQGILTHQIPQRPTRYIDQVKIIAERPKFIESLAIQDATLAIEPPLILIEGYMPLQTLVPEYPRAALHQAIEGQVTVKFTIAMDGTVVDPVIVHAQPRRVFDRAVLAAIKEWRYRPQIFNGNPVELEGVTEIFTFQLAPASADARRR